MQRIYRNSAAEEKCLHAMLFNIHKTKHRTRNLFFANLVSADLILAKLKEQVC